MELHLFHGDNSGLMFSFLQCINESKFKLTEALQMIYNGTLGKRTQLSFWIN